MPRFKYEAVSLTGEKQTGEHTAVDQNGVIAMLREGGFYHTSIVKIADDTKKAKGKIPVKVLAGFCSQMATLMRAGVPISKALEILTSQTEHPVFRSVLDDVYNSVLKGLSLSESFAPYTASFPPLMTNMIEAGEASGTLDSCMDRAGESFMRIAKLNNKVKNAMIYPAIILIVLIGLLVLMLVVVIPMFSSMYADAGSELPGFTQVLLNVSDFVTRFWYIFLAVAIGAVVGFKTWLKTEKGRLKFDSTKLRLPIVSKLLKIIYAARFSRTLASLGSAGVPLTEGLTVTARSVLNRLIETEIYKAVDGISRGELLSTQLEKMGLFPPMIVYMVKLGEETGTMDDLLNQAADYYDEESDSAMQALTAMLEPLLIIVMAAIVVPILIGVLLPMFNMHDMML